MKKLFIVPDLIRELEKYIEENGDGRIIVDLETEKEFRGNDSISRLVSVPEAIVGDPHDCPFYELRDDLNDRE